MGTCRPRAGLFLPVLIFAVILPAVFATSPCRADVRSTLLKAYRQYAEGDVNGAVESFETAFKQDPSNEVLYNFVQKISVAAMFRMARSGDERLAGTAISILNTTKQVQLEKVGDREAIRQAIDEVLASSVKNEGLRLQIEATRVYGRNLVPQLIPELANQDLRKRTAAFVWIARSIGVQAVPALQTAQKHPDPTVRLNVAELLGTPAVR
ncbi:MAG: hypothetical protein MK538_01070, partial [Planctomycetes bacterium]|nr:hypothetical protein [Planctomycetota bacterium]